MGIFLAVSGFAMGDGGGALIFFGCVLLAISVLFLFKAIRKRTRTQLTEAGAAAKARDDEVFRKRKEQRDQTFASSFCFVVVMAAIVWFWKPLSDDLSNRTTVYVVQCLDEGPDGVCKPGGWTTAGVLEYTVHAEQQVVILNAPDFPGGHLKLLHPWPGQTPPPGGGGTMDDYAV